MKLYAKPIVTTDEDGTISVKVPAITPEYVNTRLEELAILKRINYNLDEVINTVKEAPSEWEAQMSLWGDLKIAPHEARLLLEMSLEDLTHINPNYCEAEAVRWRTIKTMLEEIDNDSL